MPVEMEIGGAAFAEIIDRLRKIVPNLGNVFFVDCDNGVDAPGRGTYALPLRTIDYAISNYAVAWRNDAFICWGSAGGGFDENVNAEGVLVDVPGTVICGYNFVRVNNTNAGATGVFTVSASSCWILGFTIQPSTAIIGIDDRAGGTLLKIGYDESFYNIFVNCSEDVRMSGNGSKAYSNRHVSSLIGYSLRATTCDIKDNVMQSTGGAGTFGITTTAGGDNNFIHGNIILGYNTGINMVINATGNVIAKNSIACTNLVADANGVNVNLWVGNESRSRIVHTNTIEQDLKDIYDKCGGGPGPSPEPTEVGDVFFVSTTGNDVTGEGTLGNPWRTIDHAVAECVANHNDMIVCWSPNGVAFDENVNADGVQVDVAGVKIVGVDWPQVTNNNLAATSVFNLIANNTGVSGFAVVVPIGGACFGIAMGGDRCKVDGNAFESAGLSGGVITTGDSFSITNCKFTGGGMLAIQVDGSTEGEIHDNWFTNCQTGIDVLNGASRTLVRNNVFEACLNTCWNVQATAGLDNFFVENSVVRGLPPTLATDTLMIGNGIDKVDLLHSILIAHGVTEIPIMDVHPLRSGALEFQADVETLALNEIGKMATFRMYHMVDNTNLRLMDQITFLSGSDLLFPRLRGYVEGGMGNVRITVQMDQAVTANRDVAVKVLQET